MAANNKETLCLDVGGSKYKVPRSLIERYPNTMLARLVSDTWLKDPSSEIFVDRNGFRFQFVLDYMRDEKVFLPMSVPKPSMLQELEYFGFENIPPDAINESYSTFEAATHVVERMKRHQEGEAARKKKIKDMEIECGYEALAFECFMHYIKNGSLFIYTYTILRNKENPSYEQFSHLNSLGVDKNSFNASLSKFGLTCKLCTWNNIKLEALPAEEGTN